VAWAVSPELVALVLSWYVPIELGPVPDTNDAVALPLLSVVAARMM
jgi:hypothetical protein